MSFKYSVSQVLSIHNLQCHAGVFTRMLLNKGLVDAVSELIGSPNVLLHHTKAHIKPPGVGAPFPTHQVKIRESKFFLGDLWMKMLMQRSMTKN